MRRLVIGLALCSAACASQALPPPNAAAAMHYDAASGRVTLTYAGSTILSGTMNPGARATTEIGRGLRESISEKIRFTAPALALDAIAASPEAIAAETYGEPQRRFALIRTSSGPDHNLRNNAIYDRRGDWVLEFPEGTVISPIAPGRFHVTAHGPSLLLRFLPRYYQLHRNLAFYQPWTYDVWQQPVAGWSSWWAYEDRVTEANVRQVTQLFAAKLRDYGYTYIQLDDGYHPRDGDPGVWTQTNAKFPSGLGVLAGYERSLGMQPAIWENIAVSNTSLVASHPAWFLQGPAPWIGYGVNGANPAALDALIRPTYRQLHAWGYDYVKVDTLRHLLYDAHATPDEFRALLSAIRDELGPQTYLLACWGVLPEAVGIANGDRLGTDGFGPATLQQYNSWNNLVWRNDPDHVDIAPPGENVIRPVEVSMAGAQLMLSDPASVYTNDANLEGARRSAPVLFTLPGQLYDYDPTATNNLALGLRNQDGGANPGPIDAEREGALCPWWLMDISRPWGNWSVLARLGESAMPEAQVKFTDLGLRADTTYLVYEFWTNHYVGAFRGAFPAAAQPAQVARVYAIRPLLDRPQIVSTSRHITQGGEDLVSVHWDAATRTLSGTSRVVANDPYQIVIHLPAGYRPTSGAALDANGLTTLTLHPARTGTQTWKARFATAAAPVLSPQKKISARQIRRSPWTWPRQPSQ